jgi:hypothetical protein
VQDTTYTSEIRISTLDCSNFTNPYQMLEYANMRLADYASPRISYVLKAMDLSVLTGYEHEAWELGDTVMVKDDDLNLSGKDQNRPQGIQPAGALEHGAGAFHHAPGAWGPARVKKITVRVYVHHDCTGTVYMTDMLLQDGSLASGMGRTYLLRFSGRRTVSDTSDSLNALVEVIENKKQDKRVVSVTVVPTITDCSGRIWFTDLNCRKAPLTGYAPHTERLSEGIGERSRVVQRHRPLKETVIS